MAFNPKNVDLERAVKNRSETGRHAALDFKPPRYFRVFRNLLIGGVVLAMTAVLYTIYWFTIATNMKDSVTDWIAARAAEGVVASYRQIEISGFPIKFKVVLTEPKIQTAELIASSHQDSGAEKWLWQGGKAIAEMKPWNFKKFSVDLSGAHQVTYEDQRKAYQFSGTAQRFMMDAEIFTDGWPEKFQIDIGGLVMSELKSKAVVSAKSALVTSHRLMPGVSPTKENAGAEAKTSSYALKAKLQAVHLPNFLNLPLGHDIQELSTELKVIGRLGLSTKVQNLATWRDGGGIIEIGLLDGIYGSLKTHATGTLALDKDLQPMGAMVAKFQGFFSAINALKKAGYVRSGDAAMAKVVLGVLSRRDGKGQRSISLPLTLQDGQLTAGPVPLMAVPAIDWGEDVPPPKKPN